MKLDKEEYLEYAPSSPGKVRVNHASDECDGDSKSMLIERKDDGTVTAYCFRCQAKGIHSTLSTRLQAAKNNASSDEHKSVSRYSRSKIYNVSAWPVHAIKWLTGFGISQQEIKENGIFYDTYRDRLVFPIYWDDQLELNKEAQRLTNPKGSGPKWLSYNKGTPWYRRLRGKMLVVTEDIVSAIVMMRYADAIALLTTTISDDILMQLDGYDNYVIWLDNDNKQVKLNQLKLRHKFQLLGNTDVVHETDPKNCSPEVIDDRLRYIKSLY